jgi:hypothetical protein
MKFWRPAAIGALALLSVLSLAAFRAAPSASFALPTSHSAMMAAPPLGASAAAMLANVTQHPPQDCLSVPIPIRDPVTGQLITFNEDATFRAWMMAYSCRASGFPQGGDFAVVWLTAKTQCQTVTLGKPYQATYTDADGQSETIWTKTGLTILQGDHIVYVSPASTSQLCPGHVMTLLSPLMSGANTYLALFSLALPSGGFDGSHFF